MDHFIHASTLRRPRVAIAHNMEVGKMPQLPRPGGYPHALFRGATTYVLIAR